MTACGKKWRLLCSFTSLWEFKDLLFSSPILRISICCFHSSSLQLRDSQDLAVAASKVLIDTGFQVRRHEEVEMRIRSCVYAWMCVLEGGGWLGIDSFRMLWALERVFHTHTHAQTLHQHILIIVILIGFDLLMVDEERGCFLIDISEHVV